MYSLVWNSLKADLGYHCRLFQVVAIHVSVSRERRGKGPLREMEAKILVSSIGVARR